MAIHHKKRPPSVDWHRADIKAALEKRGFSITRLAELHGIRPTTLAHTFDRPYPINERRIADVIGVPAHEIWPSRYNPDGSPRQRGVRRSSLAALQSTALNCQRNGNSAKAV